MVLHNFLPKLKNVGKSGFLGVCKSMKNWGLDMQFSKPSKKFPF